jgi:hypothetical protein
MNQNLIREFFTEACNIGNCPHFDQCRNECPNLDNSSNSTPQPGFIGRHYKGLVIIGSNPGIPDSKLYQEMEPIYLKHIHDFAVEKDFQKFLDYIDYLSDYMAIWKNNLTNNYFRDLLKYDIGNIAYLNIVKCRSINVGSDPFNTVGYSITRRCFTEHTLRQLDILKPKWIVGHWKTIPGVLKTLGYRVNQYIPCYSGKRDWTYEQRAHEIIPFFKQLQSASDI